MPQSVRVNNTSTALDIAPAVLHLPAQFAEEVARQIRNIFIPRLQRLTPRQTGRLADSYRLRPPRIVEGQDPLWVIEYISYGRWTDFDRPVYVNGFRVETVPALIAAVFRDQSSQVYTQALRSFARRYGIEIADFDIEAEVRKWVIRRLLFTVLNQTRGGRQFITGVGILTGYALSAPIREATDEARREFFNRLQGITEV